MHQRTSGAMNMLHPVHDYGGNNVAATQDESAKLIFSDVHT